MNVIVMNVAFVAHLFAFHNDIRLAFGLLLASVKQCIKTKVALLKA